METKFTNNSGGVAVWLRKPRWKRYEWPVAEHPQSSTGGQSGQSSQTMRPEQAAHPGPRSAAQGEPENPEPHQVAEQVEGAGAGQLRQTKPKMSKQERNEQKKERKAREAVLDEVGSGEMEIPELEPEEVAEEPEKLAEEPEKHAKALSKSSHRHITPKPRAKPRERQRNGREVVPQPPKPL